MLCRCKDHFDFSDHIVMYIAHYLVPCAMELAVVATRAFSERGSVLSICLQYGVSLGACVLFLSVAIRAMFLSCMFFHTPLESIAGAALVVLLVVTPCFFLDGSTYWRAACVGPKLARLSL